jgi:accessory gene regulator protein AgrB
MHANMPQKVAKYNPTKAKYDLVCYEKLFAKIKKKAFCISIMLFIYILILHYLIS